MDQRYLGQNGKIAREKEYFEKEKGELYWDIQGKVYKRKGQLIFNKGMLKISCNFSNCPCIGSK